MPIPSDLVAFTFSNKTGDISDAVFNELTLYATLRTNGHVILDGGTKIERSLEFAKNTTAQFMQGADVVNTTIENVHTHGSWDYRQMTGTVGITAQEEIQNSGKSKVVDLLDARKQNLITSLQDTLETASFATPPGVGSVSLEGLQEAVADNPTTNPTRANYGGIPRSNTFWRNKYQVDLDSSLSATSLFAFIDRGLEFMRKGYRKASKGENVDNPNLIVWTEEIDAAYEAEVAPKLQLRMAELKGGDPGTSGLMFKKAKITYSAANVGGNTNGHRMYMLNTKYFYMVSHRDKNFVMGPFQEPVNQTVRTGKVIWFGNLICTNPIRQLVVRGFTV